MSLSIVVTRSATLPAGRPVTLAALRLLGLPSVSISGSVATGDLAPGAVTAAKVTPDAYAYAAATGTDAYAATFNPAVTAYANGLQLQVKFANPNATTTPTLNANGVGAKKLRFRGDLALRAGDIQANCILALVYNSSLDAAAGGWEIQNIREDLVIGAASNLAAAWLTAATVNITSDELQLKTAGGLSYLASVVNVTVDITVAGANGLDTGVEANSTWYYLWVVYNPTTATVAGLISASATAPTLPAGYTFRALVGNVYNGSGGDLVEFVQHGKIVRTATLNIFTAKTATAGNTYQILAAGDLTAFQAAVPPNAVECFGVLGTSNGADNARLSVCAVKSDGTLATSALGETVLNVAVTGATFNSFASGANFNVPVRGAASRNIQWACANNTNQNRLSVTGYRLP